MTAKEKNKLGGILLLAHGGFLGLLYLLMFILFGFALFGSGAPGGFVLVLLAIAFLFSGVFVIPQIIGGWKLLKERPDARNWGLAAAIFACMNAPLGTAAGVFVLIFLFGDEGKLFYDNRVYQNYLPEAEPVNDFDFERYREKQPHGWR